MAAVIACNCPSPPYVYVYVCVCACSYGVCAEQATHYNSQTFLAWYRPLFDSVYAFDHTLHPYFVLPASVLRVVFLTRFACDAQLRAIVKRGSCTALYLSWPVGQVVYQLMLHSNQSPPQTMDCSCTAENETGRLTSSWWKRWLSFLQINTSNPPPYTPPDIIVATPAGLREVLTGSGGAYGWLWTIEGFEKRVRHIVLDEADMLLGDAFVKP
eukprot:scaffold135518_cov22-Tisochrysis_lutea.AAC.1